MLPEKKDDSYYGVSFLKPPVWKSAIGIYFFLGGLSGGSYAVARVAEWTGREQKKTLTRVGTLISFVSALPCAPLLIEDLGDPKRFLYMLRVFKPKSPMNLGAWTLTAHTAVVTGAVLREIVGRNGLWRVTDVVGVPLALLLASYTGVLISTTATPVWSKNPWLGPLFMAGGFASGVSAISVAVEDEGLEKLHDVGHLAETITFLGFVGYAGKLAKPLLAKKKAAIPLAGFVGGLAASSALMHVPAKSKGAKRARTVVSSLIGLAGIFALRMALLNAGTPSAEDAKSARRLTRARKPSRGVEQISEPSQRVLLAS